MSVINTLDGLRLAQLGPILEARHSEVEIKNIYRALRTIEALLRQADLTGASSVTLDDAPGIGGVTLVHDGTGPALITVKLLAGTGMTLSLDVATGLLTITNTATASGEHTRRLSVIPVGVTGGSVVTNWVNATTGLILPATGDATPPAQSAHYSVRVPSKVKSGTGAFLTIGRYFTANQSSDADVKFRVQWNTTPLGVIGSLNDFTTSPLNVDDVVANNVAFVTFALGTTAISSDDLFHVTLSVDSDGTTITGDTVVLDVPVLRVTLTGL